MLLFKWLEHQGTEQDQNDRCVNAGSTLMNEQSSRSHAIVSLVLEQQPPDGSPGDVVTAKFHLVDLAGSERAKKTGQPCLLIFLLLKKKVVRFACCTH